MPVGFLKSTFPYTWDWWYNDMDFLWFLGRKTERRNTCNETKMPYHNKPVHSIYAFCSLAHDVRRSFRCIILTWCAKSSILHCSFQSFRRSSFHNLADLSSALQKAVPLCRGSEIYCLPECFSDLCYGSSISRSAIWIFRYVPGSKFLASSYNSAGRCLWTSFVYAGNHLISWGFLLRDSGHHIRMFLPWEYSCEWKRRWDILEWLLWICNLGNPGWNCYICRYMYHSFSDCNAVSTGRLRQKKVTGSQIINIRDESCHMINMAMLRPSFDIRVKNIWSCINRNDPCTEVTLCWNDSVQKIHTGVFAHERP